ncbi:MAG: hypothetical protein YSLV5_ORF27 [Yellowstone Lake virophage 5]|uniref:Uncharacterized protein n=1 Tax=Yellowstone Lake virophage 5 TaxID=1557033 RepID=A0A0A0RL40_9VIRU|nr:MAG: hypothetical protein ASQ69_gp27 [Yellowstone Lake virophage 5]AIW01885.1 MAG: hypothetical protein YSLV5_ORF27 [Yellowstone Lake virophage 5]
MSAITEGYGTLHKNGVGVIANGISDGAKMALVEAHRKLGAPTSDCVEGLELWSWDLDTGEVALDNYVGKSVRKGKMANDKNEVVMTVKALVAQEKARKTLAKRRLAKGGAGGE